MLLQEICSEVVINYSTTP